MSPFSSALLPPKAPAAPAIPADGHERAQSGASCVVAAAEPHLSRIYTVSAPHVGVVYCRVAAGGAADVCDDEGRGVSFADDEIAEEEGGSDAEDAADQDEYEEGKAKIGATTLAGVEICLFE
jgi:hypothetical protein